MYKGDQPIDPEVVSNGSNHHRSQSKPHQKMGGNRLWNFKKEEKIRDTSGSSVGQLFSSGMGVIEAPPRKVIFGQNSVPNFLATGLHMKQVI